MLNEAQTQRYLARIGAQAPMRLDRETLDGLVHAHQCAVPFETVTLHRGGQSPSLDLNDLYEKVVEERLGGYCFELNKLFEYLLRALGFNARPALSRAVRGREGRMPINHRGIIVELDGSSYAVDVGFGGPMPAGALLLEADSDQLIDGETFAVRPAAHGWHQVERITRAKLDAFDDGVPSRRQVELEICSAAVEEQDFDALNEFFARPGTLFRDHEIVNLRTPDGYLGFKDGVLTIRKNGERQIQELSDQAAIDEALAEVFGLRDI